MATPPNQRRPVKPPEPGTTRCICRGADSGRLNYPHGQCGPAGKAGPFSGWQWSLLAAPFPSSAQNAMIESLGLTAVPRRSHRINGVMPERIF